MLQLNILLLNNIHINDLKNVTIEFLQNLHNQFDGRTASHFDHNGYISVGRRMMI